MSFASTVAVDLRFLKPFKSQAITRFDVQPAEGGAAVTWTMAGAKTLARQPGACTQAVCRWPSG